MDREVAVDFNKICRLCMCEEPKMTSIFIEQSGAVPLPLRIMACVSIEITAADPLPSQICNTCLCQVDNWYKFKDLCENADAALRRLASSDAMNYDVITQIQETGRCLKKKFQSLQDFSDRTGMAEAENTTDGGEQKTKSGDCRQEENFKTWRNMGTQVVVVDVDIKTELNQNSGDYKQEESYMTMRSTGTQMGDVKPEPLHALNLQYNSWPAPGDSSEASEASESDSGAENHPAPDGYSSDDSLTLLAHKEKLLKEKQTRKRVRRKKEPGESGDGVRVSRTMQTQTGDDGADSALEISIEEVAEEGKKKRRNKRTQTGGAKKRFRIRPAVPSACTLCDKVYKNAEILRQHIKSHHVSGNIECQHCQTKFSSLRSLKYHEQRNHSNLEPVPCSFCGKKFLDKKYLRIHENIHSQTNQYVCQFCGRKFIMKTNLTVHISRHHTQKTNDFICQVCGKAFPFKLYLKKHFKTHTDYKPHSCSHCEARFRESTLLRKHINSIHLKLRPFLCQYCQKTFTRSLYLREHLESQHLGIPKKMECMRCGENFHNRSRLRQHDCEGRLEVLQ